MQRKTSMSPFMVYIQCATPSYYLKVTSCKEGLIKPPKRPGKQGNIVTNRSKELNGDNRWPGKDITKNKQKPHPILADLENRHASADVEKSLNIKSGQRIRLHYSPGHQADVDYESHEYHQKLSDRKEQSNHDGSLLESDYSDFEVDSIIRSLPIDDDQAEGVKMPQDKFSPEMLLPAESRKRKLPLFRQEFSSPQEEVELVEGSHFKPQTATSLHTYDTFQADLVKMQRSPEMPLQAESRKRKTPLFRENSPSLQKRIKLGGNSNFKPQATTVRVYDLFHLWRLTFFKNTRIKPSLDSDSDIEIIDAGPVQPTKAETNTIQLYSNTEYDDDVAKELAALDEWLTSGTVGIVNDV